MNKRIWKPIMLIILCTLFTSIGQILFKYASKNTDSIIAIITNIPLILGLISYGLGFVVMIIALKYGDLSLIYPFIALSFIWVTIASIILFNENVNMFNWTGIIFIIAGVTFIGLGSK